VMGPYWIGKAYRRVFMIVGIFGQRKPY